MKKIWILLIILSIWLWWFFYFKNIKTQKDIQEIISNTWISEEDKKDLQEDLSNKNIDKTEVNNKINNLKNKIKLKWLISKANMYYDENEYMIALMEYQKILKNIPNDEEINAKIWDIYYKIHKYKKANEHYEKIKNSKFLDKEKAIFSLINDNWIDKENIEEIKKKINDFEINEEEKFYYTNSITCIVDYSLCRDSFQKYFEKNKNFEIQELKTMFEAFENFKNFKDNSLYYKAAFVTWAFFQNWFYYVSLKTSEWILKEKWDYKPMMKVASKSAYEIWDYISAKKYLTEIRKTEENDPEVSYFLARVYEKLNDKVPALVNYQKALKDWHKDIIDIKRRIIFLYFDAKENKKMLKEFDELLRIDSKEINENDYSLAIYYNIIDNNIDKARHYTEKWIKIFWEKTEVFYWYMAWIMLQRENLSNIELRIIKANIDKANKINKNNPMILMVNWIYEVKIKNYEKAILNLKSANSFDKSGEYKEIINLWIERVNLEKNLEEYN